MNHPAPYLLEDNPQPTGAAPAMCPERNRLMLDWCNSPEGWEREIDLLRLREHEKGCHRCKRRNSWIFHTDPPAHPHDQTIEQLSAPGSVVFEDEWEHLQGIGSK